MVGFSKLLQIAADGPRGYHFIARASIRTSRYDHS
jgi:hypothetical protein